MTELCPRSCCWLTTAGFFILIGTIQFSAGLVLLKSKYVFLLSGPDFWTAAGNIFTGCMLGIAASVWKKPRKRLSSRHVARVKVVSALLVSSGILNATTLTLLVMGEGNTLLTIKVETMEKDSYLGWEILRIAYATSVVCPVVCVVVVAMALTEECCTTKAETSVLKTPKKMRRRKSFAKETPKNYEWVFNPEKNITEDSTQKSLRQSKSPSQSSSLRQSTSSSQSSSGGDEFLGNSSIELTSPISKYPVQSTPTVKDLQNSLARMSQSRISNRPPEDSMDYSCISNTSLAGEVVAIQIRKESSDRDHAVPVGRPLIGEAAINQFHDSTVVDAAPTRVRTTAEDRSSKLKRTKLSSFKAAQKDIQRTEHFSPPKKCQRLCRSPAMESIIELPSSEDANFLCSPSVTSGYVSSPEVPVSNNSRDATSLPTVPREIIVPVEMVTPKKASAETIPKELYGKISLFQERISRRAKERI